MSNPLMLWYIARTQQEQDIRRAATWRRAHTPPAAVDGGRVTRPPRFKRPTSLVGTAFALLVVGVQFVGGAAAAAPAPPDDPGLPVAKLPRVNPTRLNNEVPLWPWLIAAAVGIVFITWLVVRIAVESSGRRQPRTLLNHDQRPSTTH